ncbi:MAG: hypothetical protein NTZ39_06390 [Methanoregula sp.]|nr:hypothetical protein [Methanoregula sp.]
MINGRGLRQKANALRLYPGTPYGYAVNKALTKVGTGRGGWQ